jgi:ubiquinone/menaquinone biosynthesis C-methylase UbiE
MRRLPIVAALLLTASLAAQQPGVHPISGRAFAPVMGWQGAGWLERPERLEEEEPETALDILKIKKGAVVADIGAGSGYMTMRLVKRVGPAGTVYANDIQPQMLQFLQQRIDRAKIGNVVLVQSAVDDPRLPEAALDLELLVDVYHEFSRPQAMLRHLRDALKPTGRLVLVEYRKEDPAIPIKFEHKMSVKEARMEVEAEGLKLSDVNEELPRQHILIFTKP